jgi:PUA-domain protein
MPVRRHLKDKEVRQAIKEFAERYPYSEEVLKKSREFEELIVDETTILFVDGRPLILRTRAGFIPTLKFEEVINRLPKVVVDMGAVAHLANGAHLMRPGIRRIDQDFPKGELVVIVDERYGKAIALGVAEMDSGAVRSTSKGRVIMNVHYAGDAFWAAFSKSAAV